MGGTPKANSNPPPVFQLPSQTPDLQGGRMQARSFGLPRPPRLPVVELAGGDPGHVPEAQNHRESMRLMNSHNIARVTPDPAPPSPKQSDSSPKAPAPDWRAALGWQ